MSPSLPRSGEYRPNTDNHPMVTPWFQENSKPPRTGLYQVLATHFHGSQTFVEWCWFEVGRGWGWAYVDKRAALSKVWRNPDGATQGKIWRGLREPWDPNLDILARELG